MRGTNESLRRNFEPRSARANRRRNDSNPLPRWHLFRALAQAPYKSDLRWPTKCDYCDYVFPPDVEGNADWKRQYTDGKTFGILPGHIPLGVPEFGAGAMWRATWLVDEDGQHRCWYWENCTSAHLIVMTPGGSWDTDSRASNCTMPNDKTHRCWVKHGAPPNLTIDKNGVTCQAGAGSILSGNYHGCLSNGELT